MFPTFLMPWFAIAGLAAAAGPVVIHLLNRRRYRIVHWAAMDFLREAIFRSRRILQLRDLLLLLLRMAVLIAFGAALAHPFFNKSGKAVAGPDQPVHAVVLVDNSMSMGYEQLKGVLLDDAKAKAKEVIEGLPRGSQVSVLPTCGSAKAVRYEAYSSPEEAIEALMAIQPVDRETRPDAVIDSALDACRLVSMTPKRIVLVADQQVASWPGESMAEHLKQLPAPMQVIQVTPDTLENAWVSDFELRDGVADLQTPATLVATVGYEGPAREKSVEVTLSIDGAAVATQTVDLQSGQLREIEFPPYRFDIPTEPGKPAFVTAEVSIPHDRLPADDQRFLVVPVVASLPVVFVDSLGSNEDPRHNRYGETFFLRRLLAPLTSRAGKERQLVEVRHVRMDQVSQDTLADARLVVIAGVSDPKGLTPLLRDYVEQGGNLVIAAGGDFDPAAWTEAGWADGMGILPAPLEPAPVGKLPEETNGQLAPFFLDFDTLVHDYFLPAGTAVEELKAMYGPRVMFFKAVAAKTGDDVDRQVNKAVQDHFQQQHDKLAELSRREAELKAGDPSSVAQRDEIDRQRAELRPDWLLWGNRSKTDEGQRSLEELARRARPVVLGRYTNGLPFLVRRQWGQGQVLLISTGVSPSWNTLPIERQAVWVYDRVLRGMLQETFPKRTLSTEQSLLLPIPASERTARFGLTDASGQDQPLSVDALGNDRYGIELGNWMQRGVFRVTATRTSDARASAADAKLWDIPFAVNGPAEESELGSAETGAHARAGRTSFVEATQAGVASVVELQGTEVWTWVLLAAVLAGLLLELAILAWFTRSAEQAS